jgi:agmatine/peptidylarginine deiminase
MKRLVAEFQKQSFTQVIFPHKDTDWAEYLDEAQQTFENIICNIAKYQKCRVICADISDVKKRFSNSKNIEFIKYKTDDTWARDCSALSIEHNNKIQLLDFTFNGWGSKFEASKDNAMTKAIYKDVISYDFILEGGAIESNGVDKILTTSKCMLNKNRNKNLTKDEITAKLKNYFGAKDILYLEHGYLAGDDTDSHIDTLARFIDEKTILYVECKDKNDEHYNELLEMKNELIEFANIYNLDLIALPMSDAIYFKNERLPATYANFLFVNGAVLVPIYGVNSDKEALEVFKNIFKDRDIIAIDCSVLIRQHGSLHCVTMNFA